MQLLAGTVGNSPRWYIPGHGTFDSCLENIAYEEKQKADVDIVEKIIWIRLFLALKHVWFGSWLWNVGSQGGLEHTHRENNVRGSKYA